MCFTNQEMKPRKENIFLSSVNGEIDNIFLQLRKADRIIYHEINCLEVSKVNDLKNQSLPLIDATSLKTSIDRMSLDPLWWDEHIIYMLNDRSNNLFRLIEEYNEYLKSRQIAQSNQNYTELRQVDNRLTVAIRRLGAMFYHFNSHLNSILVWLEKTTIQASQPEFGAKCDREYLENLIANS